MGRRPSEIDASTWRGQVAARLRELRIARNLTQQQLRDRLDEAGLGVHIATVSGWERGYRLPSLDDLPLLAIALGVSAHELLPQPPGGKAALAQMISNLKAQRGEADRRLREFIELQLEREEMFKAALEKREAEFDAEIKKIEAAISDGKTVPGDPKGEPKRRKRAK
jgi:transcriptional regulator with XRE-family HTH domain